MHVNSWELDSWVHRVSGKSGGFRKDVLTNALDQAGIDLLTAMRIGVNEYGYTDMYESALCGAYHQIKTGS